MVSNKYAVSLPTKILFFSLQKYYIIPIYSSENVDYSLRPWIIYNFTFNPTLSNKQGDHFVQESSIKWDFLKSGGQIVSSPLTQR